VRFRFSCFLILLVLGFLPSAGLADFPATVIDCLGRKVLLEKMPQRIVITGRAGFMITNASLFFASAPEKLLTYSKNFQFRNSDGFYRLIDPFFAKRTFSDHTIGIEELAAMKPDLIMARDIERANLERGLEQLEIPIVFFNLENPESYYSDLENLGLIYAETQKAERIIDFFQNWHQKILQSVKSSKSERKPSVLHLFYSERGGAVSFSVSPKHWIQSTLVRDAGGVPVWSEAALGNGWQKIGFEQIAAWNPDFIFVASYFGNSADAVEKLKKNELWQGLTAVKQNRLLAFPEDYISWDQPDSRWVLGLCWCAAMINPDLQGLKVDMHKLYQEFFELYGIDAEQSRKIKVTGDYF
jgi:iron complex transport system substrate-binding protein